MVGDTQLPPVELLRAGLTALEDGCELDAEHRSLLLRSALQHGRGVLTALRHSQDDPERTRTGDSGGGLDRRYGPRSG